MNADAFLADVLREPETLAGLLDVYGASSSPLHEVAALDPARDRVVLIGMGSSRFAALTAASALRARGVWAHVEYASTGVPTPPSPQLLAVGISASGATEETVEALARHHGVSRTLAITNRPDGPMAAVADGVLPLLAGEEAGGVACRTFQATVAVLLLLSGIDSDALRPAVEAQAALIDARERWVEPLLAGLAGAHTVYTIAPAERRSSAEQSALMFREGPRVAADATETGDWLHVDVYLSKHPAYTAMLFGGSRYDAAVMTWARERASTVVAVGRPVDGAALHVGFQDAEDPLVCALVEVSVAELAAAVLWQRRIAARTMP